MTALKLIIILLLPTNFIGKLYSKAYMCGKNRRLFTLITIVNTRLALARLTQLVYVDIARVHKIVLIKNFFAHRHMHM